MKKRLLALLVALGLILTVSPVVSTVFAEDEETTTAEGESENVEPAEPEKTAEEKEAEQVAAGRERLLAAYKKEFAFLENEKSALQERVAEIAKEHEKYEGRMTAEIDALEEKLMALKSQLEEAQKEFTGIEETSISYAEAGDLIETTVSQAEVTLEKHGLESFEAPEGLTEAERTLKGVDYVFSNALEVLDRLSSVTVEDGRFFLKNGEEVSGKVVKFGQIAMLGVGPDGGGTLAPTGGSLLKVWREESLDAARTLADGGQPEILPLYIYESLEKMVEQDIGKTPTEVVEAGGVIAYVIVGIGAIAVLMLLLRAIFLYHSAADISTLLKEVTPLVKEGDIDKALALCKKVRGAASRVLASTIKHIDAEPAQLEDVISESILHETPYLERFESAILVFAAVSPLLGLLGTVTGMISTFDVITVYGTGDPKLLSGGISEALITTQLGLMVAIPALLFGNLLSGWSEGIKSEMEQVALSVTNASKGHNATTWHATDGEGDNDTDGD